MRREKHSAYFNLLDAFKEGCPLCYLAKRSASRYIDNLLYEHVNDPQIRQKLRKTMGFCNKHAWQMQKSGEALGISIIYEDLLKVLAAKLENAKSIRSEGDICPACDQQKMSEKRYTLIFIENMLDHELLNTYINSFGLCLPHLSMVIERCKDAKTIKKIKDIELKKIDALIKELEELQRKYDYRFSKEIIGKEGTAWIRVIEKITGKEGVF